MVNHNETTGIAYGIISAQSLHDDIVQELMYGSKAKDLSYQSALADFIAEKRRDFDDGKTDDDEFDTEFWENQFSDHHYGNEEPIIEGEYDGVKYRTCWLGGALNFFIFESPITVKCGVCSPCVPATGNLDDDGDYVAYGVPSDWWYEGGLRTLIEKFDYIVYHNIRLFGYMWDKKDSGSAAGVSSAVFQTTEEAAVDCYLKNIVITPEQEGHG